MNVPFVIALFVQTLMYGFYVTTLVHCLRWLFYDDKGWKLREKINWAMATITVLVFMFFTIDLALTLQITVGSLENWGKPLLDRINVVTIMIENITILIVDAVLIHRCWAVYGRSWRIVLLPVVLWFGIFTSSIVGVFVVAVTITEPINIQLSLVWAVFFLCNIIVNIYATSAIIYRILRVAKETGQRSSRLHNTCRIL
ncbi:hypothetical protein M378DRAFT_11952 [Amanita muscaria Koide BX008]|uniref:Transmembrane protein n=1 Tax=Amanita muscaria (strain Koide BX008) TaxID=946122 RepID=A0A0C2X395_AMAMK|nr:hypothetical protein M378DRAFT_11952 [Amanita muscaria Koide BX008]